MISRLTPHMHVNRNRLLAGGFFAQTDSSPSHRSSLNMLRRKIVVAIAVVAMASTPIVAQAQTQIRSWAMCGNASQSSLTNVYCSDYVVRTTPIVTNGLRSGTTVSVSVHNLQGQNALDTSPYSLIYPALWFRAPQGLPTDGSLNQSSEWLPWNLSGGAIISGAYPTYEKSGLFRAIDGYGTSSFPNGTFHGYYVYFSTYTQIGGCALVPSEGELIQTCGEGAYATASWATTNLLNAEDNVMMRSLCEAQTTDFRIETGGSNTNPECGVFTTSVTTVTPEPSAYALMVAGLAGLGVVARRRRRALVA